MAITNRMNFFEEDIDNKDFYEKRKPLELNPALLPFLNEIPPVIVQNTVYSCEMQTELNLSHVFKHLRKWAPMYNVRKFPALIVRFMTDTVIALSLFESGEVLCAGAKSSMDALYMMRMVLMPELKAMGYAVKMTPCVVYNLVANTKLPFAVDLQRLADDYGDCCVYEPDVFPSAEFKHPDANGVSMSIFANGKTPCKWKNTSQAESRLTAPFQECI